MQPRTVIIYTVFVVALIYGTYFHLLSGDGNKDGISRDSSGIKVPDPVMAATVADLPIQSSARKGDDNNNEDEWIGDPFRNDQKYKKPSKPKSVKKVQRVKKPQLSAISVCEAGAMAVVDGRIVAVGEKIGSWRLIEVSDDAARFKGPEGSIWVRIGGSK